MYMCKCM